MNRTAEPIELADEQPGDAAAIRRVVEAAFGGAGEADLVERLRRNGEVALSLVGRQNAHVVGHVMLSRMRAGFRALGLAPVSVCPDRQREGIGSSLIHAAIARARAEGVDALFVLGDPSFYHRFGFSVASAAGVVSPYAGPHFMAIRLSDVALEGRADYAAAFDGLS